MYESTGDLRIRAFTAGGAIPVSGAIVRLWGADEENRDFIRSTITDRDGGGFFTDVPAPSVEYSLTPDPAERPFATYDLEVVAKGYATQKISGVSVFSGIESYQPLNLIPIT